MRSTPINRLPSVASAQLQNEHLRDGLVHYEENKVNKHMPVSTTVNTNTNVDEDIDEVNEVLNEIDSEFERKKMDEEVAKREAEMQNATSSAQQEVEYFAPKPPHAPQQQQQQQQNGPAQAMFENGGISRSQEAPVNSFSNFSQGSDQAMGGDNGSGSGSSGGKLNDVVNVFVNDIKFSIIIAMIIIIIETPAFKSYVMGKISTLIRIPYVDIVAKLFTAILLFLVAKKVLMKSN